ncbi:myelin-oligodendrocyte glycoprotein [Lampetra planeri]
MADISAPLLPLLLLLCTVVRRGLAEPDAKAVSVTVTAGGEVPLPCRGLGALSPGALVTWEWRPRAPWCVRTDGGRLLEISNKDGRKVVSDQFRGRVLVHPQLIKRGDYTVRLREVRASDAGDYTCLNQATGLHRAIRLFVNAGCTSNLLLEANPWEGVAEGDPVTLACSYCGSKPVEPRVRWLAAGVPVKSGSDIHISADGKTLNIRAATLAHRARWACIIGKKESAVAEFCLDVVEYGTTPTHRDSEEGSEDDDDDDNDDDDDEEGEDDPDDREGDKDKRGNEHRVEREPTQRQDTAPNAVSEHRESFSTAASVTQALDNLGNSAAVSLSSHDPKSLVTSQAEVPRGGPSSPPATRAPKRTATPPPRTNGATTTGGDAGVDKQPVFERGEEPTERRVLAGPCVLCLRWCRSGGHCGGHRGGHGAAVAMGGVWRKERKQASCQKWRREDKPWCRWCNNGTPH